MTVWRDWANSEGSQKALNLLFAHPAPFRSARAGTWGRRFCLELPFPTALRSYTCCSNTCARRRWRNRTSRCFDAWAAIFAKKTTDFEFNVTNNIVQKERFRYFIKVPELAGVLQRDNRLPHGGGHWRGTVRRRTRYCHHIPPTPDQEVFIGEADAVRQVGRRDDIG